MEEVMDKEHPHGGNLPHRVPGRPNVTTDESRAVEGHGLPGKRPQKYQRDRGPAWFTRLRHEDGDAARIWPRSEHNRWVRKLPFYKLADVSGDQEEAA